MTENSAPPDRPSLSELGKDDVIRTANLEAVRWPPTVRVVACRGAKTGYVALTAVDAGTGEKLDPVLQAAHIRVTRIERAGGPDEPQTFGEAAIEWAVLVEHAGDKPYTVTAADVHEGVVWDREQAQEWIAWEERFEDDRQYEVRTTYTLLHRTVPAWTRVPAPATEDGQR